MANELLKIYAKADMQGDFIEYVVAHNELEAQGNSDDETLVQDLELISDDYEIENVIFHELETDVADKMELVSTYLVERDVKRVFGNIYDNDEHHLQLMHKDWHNLQFAFCNNENEIELVFCISRYGYNVFETTPISQTYFANFHNCKDWAKFLKKIKDTWYDYFADKDEEDE